MKAAVIVSPGLEKLSQQEIKELLHIKGKIESSLLSFELDEALLEILPKLQSIRRVILPFGEICDDNITFNFSFKFKKYFKNEVKLKIEVENLKGQENRIEISKKVAAKLFSLLKKEKIKASIDYKKPDLTIIVYNTNKKMLIGMDFTGRKLNVREYRVFPHSASFKGDLAYYFVRKSGFKKNEKLLSGFCKDGAIAIEAALFSPEAEVHAFDNNISNITAAKKNSKLAKVNVNANKYLLEDLDIKYKKDHFDRVIFHVTRKDENHLNEIYYQVDHILKSKGTLLFISRKNWDITFPQKFKLITKEDFFLGESVYKLILLEKK